MGFSEPIDIWRFDTAGLEPCIEKLTVCIGTLPGDEQEVLFCRTPAGIWNFISYNIIDQLGKSSGPGSYWSTREKAIDAALAHLEYREELYDQRRVKEHEDYAAKVDQIKATHIANLTKLNQDAMTLRANFEQYAEADDDNES